MAKINIEAIQVFYHDFKKLTEINFDSSEYEIKSACLILRKLLVDNVNINNIWKEIGNEGRIYLTDVVLSKEFDTKYQSGINIYIPFLNIIPNHVINHYLNIHVDKIIKDKTAYLPDFPQLILDRSKIGKYINGKIIVGKQYITRKDIIEFVCYEQGYIHLTVDQNKVDKIKAIKNLRFDKAIDKDLMFMWHDSDLSSNPNIDAVDLVKLGEKHHFETLIILQIIKDIVLSKDVMQLYDQVKEYLTENLNGFEHKSRGEITLTYQGNGLKASDKWV